MKRKTIVLSILGNVKDAQGGTTAKRWNAWRPNIGLVSQPDFRIDEFHLLFDPKFSTLADNLQADMQQVSPDTNFLFEKVQLTNPWDFEEVYAKFYELAKKPCFHRSDADYYIHISTGSHVEQICLFLLAESHLLHGKLVQTVPAAGHGTNLDDCGPKGSITIIDLDLSRYDKLAKRFEAERQDDLTFLKQGIKTKNAAFNKMIETIERVAVRSADPILLTGPTGAGKSQLARQIYLLKKQSGKVTGKFVDVNCATLGGELAKAALFGYKKGAFTGAESNHDGYLREADGGILFLDEIGELPLEAQAMLLKAIEEKAFRPLSAATDEHSDFQLICGTNRDLAHDVTEKKFREDLLTRINLWSFNLPGLAERREDIEPNLTYELNRFAQRSGKHISFNKEALNRFLDFAHDPSNRWQGNFRDLNAQIVRMATLAEGGRITRELVEEEIARSDLSHPRFAKSEAAYTSADADTLCRILGPNYNTRFDSVDIVQLAHVIAVCLTSANAADASKKLFAVSRQQKAHANDSDRLTKYLARFGLKFREIIGIASPQGCMHSS